MTDYIKIIFKNTEPLKISDDSSSHSGQVNILSYVPGTAMRGALINALALSGEFEEIKREILSDRVSFLNGYIRSGEHDLIPSFKGFYEDKTDSGDAAKEIENILTTEKITDGNKRATIGRYCYVDNGCIYYTGVEMGSDMKINKGKGSDKKNVFRNAYVKPGYSFTAYIAVRDMPEITEKLTAVLKRMKADGTFLLGGNRSFGYGKCEILKVEQTEDIPYESFAVKTNAEGQAFLMLLSNTCMISEVGEPVGMDAELLRKKLGLNTLEIERCSTSVADVRGYNRTWHTMLPSVKMYEIGSVFRLSFPDEEISLNKMRAVMDEGLGIRTAEGYGRVIFLNKYEEVTKKKLIKKAEERNLDGGEIKEKLEKSEETTLRIAAKGYYVNCIRRAIDEYLLDPANDIRRFGLSGAQLGAIESIILANLYNGDKAFTVLTEYLCAAQERDAKKRVQNKTQKRESIAEYLQRIRKKDLAEILPLPEQIRKEVMGIPCDELFESQKKYTLTDPEELIRLKLELILSQIKYANRKER